MMKYNFIPLAGLQELAKDATCGVLLLSSCTYTSLNRV